MMEAGTGEDDTMGEVKYRNVVDALRVFDAPSDAPLLALAHDTG